MSYFNNAGASLCADNVLKAQIKYLQREHEIGAYAAAAEYKEELNAFYSNCAKLLNCGADEIAFVDSASRGWNIVIHGLPLKENDLLITLDTEFGTNLIVLKQFAMLKNCRLEVVKTNEDGSFDLSVLENLLKNNKDCKVAVCISQAVAQGSICYPVVEIGKLVKKYHALFVVDGCQSIGQMEADVQLMQCDAIMTSGRKWLRGPRGSGVLYVRKGSGIEPLFLDLATSDLDLDKDNNIKGLITRSDGKRYEMWERSFAAQLGLAIAVKNYLDNNPSQLNALLKKKAQAIREAVFANPKFITIGSRVSDSAITGFYLQNKEAEDDFKTYMNKNGVSLSYMSDWDFPLTFKKDLGISNSVRIAPSYFTNDQDIDYLIKLLKAY